MKTNGELRSIHCELPRPQQVDAGSPPMLQWIEVALLRVDPRYQRDLRPDNMRAISRIAAAFDWSKFSTVHVAPIEGGLFAIIDGQHRTHAAALCGMESVPCQVTHMDVRQQASAFAAINGLAMKVTPLQIFRAALAADEAWAVEIRNVCEDAGCVAVSYNMASDFKKPGQVHAVAYLRGLIARRKAEPVTIALRILRETDGIGNDREFYAYGLFRPILEAITSRPHALANPALTRETLERLDIDQAELEAEGFVRERRQKGQPSIGKVEALESLIGTAIDKAFSQSKVAP